MADDNGQLEHRRHTHSPHPRNTRPALTLAEQQRLWDACIVWWPTERLVLALLLEMGLRLREVCALTFDDLQPDTLSVLGKDGRVRVMPLGAETQSSIARYLASANTRGRRRQGEHAALVALNGADLAQMVRALGRRAGLNWLLSVHDLRHAAILRVREAREKEM